MQNMCIHNRSINTIPTQIPSARVNSEISLATTMQARPENIVNKITPNIYVYYICMHLE